MAGGGWGGEFPLVPELDLRRLRCLPYFNDSIHHVMKTPYSVEEGNQTKEKGFSSVTQPLQSKAEVPAPAMLLPPQPRY